MGLIHHVTPLAARERVVVVAGDLGITREQLPNPGGHIIGRGPSLPGVELVQPGGHVQVVEIRGCLHVERVVVLGRELGRDSSRRGRQRVVVGDDPLRLSVVGQAVRVRGKQLRFPAAVVLRVGREERRDRIGVLRSELLRGPPSRERADLVCRPRVRVPGVTQEERDRKLHGLDVAHVDDPDPVHPEPVGEMHLLPHPRNRVGVDPLVVARAAHVVEVVVDAIPAGPLGRAAGREASDVPPVVVGEQQRHVVRHPHALVVVILHFLI